MHTRMHAHAYTHSYMQNLLNVSSIYPVFPLFITWNALTGDVETQLSGFMPQQSLSMSVGISMQCLHLHQDGVLLGVDGPRGGDFGASYSSTQTSNSTPGWLSKTRLMSSS